MLRERKCRILDADKIGHAVIEPGEPAYDDVVREFGKEILVSDGRVDRSKLARVVFADRARLARLSQIVHPRVVDALDEEFERADASRNSRASRWWKPRSWSNPTITRSSSA